MTTETTKTYIIRTIADFLAVPPDRRSECLREFETWCSMADLIQSIADGCATMPDAFEWTDDGIRVVDAFIEGFEGGSS